MQNSVFHNIYTKKLEEAYIQKTKESESTFYTLMCNALTTIISTFKWGGKDFPKIPKFLPETSLCYYPFLAGYIENGEFNIYPAFPSGFLMDNGEYTEYTIITFKGRTLTKKREEISLCYNNSLAIPSIFTARELVTKMDKALLAVDSALERSMLPAIIECEDEETYKTLTNLYDAEKNKLPFRISYRQGLNGATASAVNDIFDSKKYDLLQMWDVYVRYRNLFYTSNGVNNIEIQKRERLTEAEGSGNDEITRYTNLKDKQERREDFVEETAEKFDKEISVELNRDSATVYNLTLDNLAKVEDVKKNLQRGINPTENEQETNESEDEKDVESEV